MVFLKVTLWLTGIVSYDVEFRGPALRQGDFYLTTVVYDEDDNEVARTSFSRNTRGHLAIVSPRLWWPYLSRNDNKFTHLYTLEVRVICYIIHYSATRQIRSLLANFCLKELLGIYIIIFTYFLVLFFFQCKFKYNLELTLIKHFNLIFNCLNF